MDAIHRGIQTSPGCLAHGGGSFFGGVEQTIAEVCFLATPAERDSRERLLPQLVRPELLRVPPIRNNSEMSDKVKEGESCCNFGLPALAVSAVVPSPVGNGNGHSESVQLTPDAHSFELPRATPTHSIKKNPPSRMEITTWSHQTRQMVLSNPIFVADKRSQRSTNTFFSFFRNLRRRAGNRFL